MTYLQPILPAFLLVALFESIRWWRSGKHGKPVILILAIAALFLLSWHPVAWALCHPFEAFYPPRLLPTGDADAIVVLASTVYSSCPPLPEPELGADTYGRCRYAAWLYGHWRRLPVVASGGGIGAARGIPYAVSMREELERRAVPASAIWLEERSDSTYENALYTAALLRQRGIHKIALVTDAYHMLRAEKCFQKQGLAVIPAPCRFRTFPPSLHLRQLIPDLESLSSSEDVLHESAGLVWYWMHGWI